MRFHHLQHLLSEMFVLAAIVLPFAAAFALVVALASWIMGGHLQALQVFSTSFAVTLGIAPIVLRGTFGPDTRVLCERCIMARKPNPIKERNTLFRRSGADRIR
jgi:hypothetical protein